MFGGIFSNYFNSTCKQMLIELCESMKDSSIYNGIDTSFQPLANYVLRIHQEKNGMLVNNFDFYANYNGWIDSIAIKGSYLKVHYSTIQKSMEIFGLKVADIELEEDYVNVEIEQSQFH